MVILRIYKIFRRVIHYSHGKHNETRKEVKKMVLVDLFIYTILILGVVGICALVVVPIVNKYWDKIDKWFK